jgi:DNA-binding GntR family transcriptional regulator
MLRETLRIARVSAPLRRQVEERIRHTILEGHFAPGARLIERKLCELLGVSRTSVREALRQLQAEGLVAILPNRAVIVASVRVSEAKQIYKVRAVLEGLAGQEFVHCGTEAQLAELGRCVKDLERIVEGEPELTPIEIKTRFYDILLAGCGNQIVREMLTLLNNRVTLLRSTSMSQPGRLPESVKELKRMIAALEARDADAAWAACVNHVERAAAVALRVLAERQDG